MNFSALYEETGEVSFIDRVMDILKKLEDEDKYLEYERSAELYSFLVTLKEHGKINNKLSILESYETVRPIVEWLELVYHKDIGLMEISEKAQISSQYLNTLLDRKSTRLNSSHVAISYAVFC